MHKPEPKPHELLKIEPEIVLETDAQEEKKVKPESDKPRSGGLDLLQMVFWLSLLLAVAAAVVAIAWPEAVGGTGPVLLIALASGGMVFLLWILRGAGRRLGLFPHKGAAEAAVALKRKPHAWIDSLDEAVLVTETGGGPVSANESYAELSRLMGAGVDTGNRPLTVDRLFGTYPGLNAPIYRLSKAARAGEARREVLPAIAIGPDSAPAQFEVTVRPLDPTKTLWRLRRLAAVAEATGAADIRALFVEDAPLGFFVSKANGNITYMNAWLRNFIGLADDIGVIRLDDILRAESLKALRKDRRTDRPTHANMFFRARDGVEKSMQTITSWSGRGADALARTIVIAPANMSMDGEARLTAASSSRPQRKDADPLFDDAPFGVVKLAGDSIVNARVLDANRSMIEMSDGGATPNARFADLFVAHDGETELSKLLIAAIDHPVELEIKSDPVRTANLFMTLDPSGYPQMAYVIDVTEQKQLEMRLAQGEKMQAIGQLAGGVAHDFNNMLTGVMLNCDKLMERHPVGDPSFQELKSIHELSARAAELVKMLLAFSRQQTFKREVVNMTDMLSNFSLLLRQLLDERVKLEIVHGRDLPMVRADKGQLENAIINLATNARDAMVTQGGGTLTIKTSRATGEDAVALGFDFVEEGEYLCIEVTDTGTGIPPEVLDKIFQPFFTTKEAGKGTGFGLATVYGIVKQSGGYICPTSRVGNGTTFRIYIPALQPHELEELERETVKVEMHPDAEKPTDLAGRGRILLVEDEDGVRGIAANLLVSRGYQVLQAADGEEALELIMENEGEIDLLISDVVLPGIDGPTLLQQAKEHLGHARVMFISGYAERDLAKTLDEERSISFLPKPFTLHQLAERVKTELKSGEGRKAA